MAASDQRGTPQSSATCSASVIARLARMALESRGVEGILDPEDFADHVFVTFEGAFLLCRTLDDARYQAAQLGVVRRTTAALLGFPAL